MNAYGVLLNLFIVRNLIYLIQLKEKKYKTN